MSRPSSPWFRKSKGTWYCTVEGRKVSLKVKGEENEKEAVRAWHRLFAGMPLESSQIPQESDEPPQTVPMVKANGVSVSEVIDGFLADAQSRVGKHTLAFYEKFCRFFKEDMGTLNADALTMLMVEAWTRKPAWSNSTRHVALGILAMAFRRAQRKGLIASNPLQGVKRPPKASRGAKALVSADAHARLVTCAEPMFAAFLKLLWLTGARPSEIAGLKAEDIDMEQGLAVLHEHKEAYLGKSRVLFFSPEAIEVIRKRDCRSGLLFPGKDGGKMTATIIGKRLKRLCVKAGVKHCIPYGYRHSFATDALCNGVPDAQVAALLGHSGTAMLHKHYSHLTARSQALRQALAQVR
jgi:integrase